MRKELVFVACLTFGVGATAFAGQTDVRKDTRDIRQDRREKRRDRR